MRLKNLNAIICGASQGIGEAIAMEFASQGANVTILARNADKLAEVCRKLPTPAGQNHQFLSVDLTALEQTKQVVDAHLANSKSGPCHILVNNSGGPPPGPANTALPEQFIAAFTQHLLANQVLVGCVLPGMKNAGRGRIINIISTSVKQPIPGLGVSNTVRGAVANWAKTLAGELGPWGITVNNILPGATTTERLSLIFGNKAQKAGVSVDRIAEEEKALIPLRRFAAPHEIAFAARFLASDEAAYISGINLPVDGGRTASL